MVLGTGLFFVLTHRNFDTEYNKAKAFDDITVLHMQDGEVIEQNIVFEHMTINSIGISAVNRTNNCEGIIEVSLLDNNGNQIWTERTNAADYILQGIKWYRVNCNVDVNQVYILSLSAQNFSGAIQFAGIAAKDNAKGANETVLFREQKLDDLSLFVEMTYSKRLDNKSRIIIFIWTIVIIFHIGLFEVLYADKKRRIITVFSLAMLVIVSAYFKLKIQFEQTLNYIIFVVIITIILLVIISSIIMLIKGCKKAEIYFTLYVALFGILYSILLPPFSAPDECLHFLASYRLSNVIMLKANNDVSGIMYMRECDRPENVKYMTNEYVVDTLAKLIKGKEDISKEIVKTRSSYEPITPITMYIPQALGITIGRLLNLNYIRLVYCGRLMNLLFFIVISILAIRIMPFGKWITFSICQIPLVMEVVSSYSYDVLIIALTFLLVSYILKLMENKKSGKKQLIILAVLCMIYAPLKPVYLPIVALVFIIPGKNINEMFWKSILYKTGVLFLAIISIGAVYIGSAFTISSLVRESIISEEQERESADLIQSDCFEIDPDMEIRIADQDYYMYPNLDFMMENPFDIIESYAGAVINLSDEWMLSALGKYLGYYDVVLPTHVSIIVMVLIYLSFACEDYNKITNMSLLKRMWVILMILGCWFAVLLTFYLKLTFPSLKIIMGVQGRYFIPSFAAVILLLQGKHIKVNNADCFIVMLSLLVQVLAIMEICSSVWSR